MPCFKGVFGKSPQRARAQCSRRMFRNVAGLHRQYSRIAGGPTAASIRPSQFVDFHGLTVTDIIKEPRRLALYGLVRAVDCRIRPRRLR